MMADTWADYSIYPRSCSTCGGRVSLPKGASFSAKVRKGKVAEARSTCHLCLALAQQARRRCKYCGQPTKGEACRGHADLLTVEDSL